MKNLYHRLGVCNSTIAVELHTGEYFTCSMKLKISDRIHDPYDIILGRDWFNMCSIGLEDKPDAAVRLSLPVSSQCLFFLLLHLSMQFVHS